MPIPVILDCDPGCDDAIAMLLMLGSDAFNILGVTTVAGNQIIEITTNNAQKILQLCGRSDISVARGRSKPLMQPLVTAPEFHGKTGLAGTDLPQPKVAVSSMDAPEFIATTLEQSPEPVSIIAVGPLSNIAVFAMAYPHLHKKISCLSIMGGAAYEGNCNSCAEFNIWNDPEAAKIALMGDYPVVFHGLDVTEQALVFAEDIAEFRKKKNPIHQFAADILENYSKFYIRDGYMGCPMHDACAVAQLIAPELFTTHDAYIDIDLDGAICRGGTIVDLRSRPRRAHKDTAKIAMEVDRVGLIKLIMHSCDALAERV